VSSIGWEGAATERKAQRSCLACPIALNGEEDPYWATW
jgi:hypothetical protein